MSRAVRAACVVVCCGAVFGLQACTAISRSNVIQYPAQEARLALPFVAMAARNQGYEVRTQQDAVAVILDDSSWLKFDVRCEYLDCEPGDFVFWVIIDEEKVARKDREAKFAWGKEIGDEIWRLATQIRTGETIPDSVPQGQP